jgi:hypothetical protein
MEKLKPCPFCGNRGELMYRGNNCWQVECWRGDCRTTGPWALTEGEAVRKWNRRKEVKDENDQG